jgi:cobalt/nickel transport system permease protein
MAFVMPFVGYFIYKLIKNRTNSEKGDYIAAFIGAYIGIVAGSFCAAIEFGIQPLLFKDATGAALYCPYALNVSLPAMVIPHLLVGLLEGAVTAGVYAYIRKMAPGVIYEGKPTNKKPLYGLIIAMIALCPLGLLASGTAWGEWGTEEIKDMAGYVPKAIGHGFKYNAFMQDYGISGLNDKIGYIISAVAGVAILLIVFKIIASTKKEKLNNSDKIEISS